MSKNFEIIYKKLEEIKSSSKSDENVLIADEKEASSSEMDEIDELRKMVLEINDPEPYTYTSSK